MKNIAKLNEFFTFLKSKDYFYEFYESMDFKPSSGDISKLMKGKYDDYKFITEKLEIEKESPSYSIDIEDYFEDINALFERIKSEYSSAEELFSKEFCAKKIIKFGIFFDYDSTVNIDFKYIIDETDESYLKRTNINLMVAGLLKLKDKIIEEYSMFIEKYDSIKNDMEKLSLEEKIKKLQSELNKLENK